MKKYVVIVIALGVILLVSGIILTRQQPSEKPLIFAELPAEGAMAQAHWQPLMDYMSQEIGRTVEFKTVADYTAVIEALKYGHADLARLGPSGYVLAEEEVDLVSIASIANDDGSLMTYQSYIVTRPGLTTLEGATFAYVDVGSTSGYLLPATYIKKEGIELGKTLYAGSHPAVMEAVKNGSVDAGATNDARWRAALDDGLIKPGELSIFWQSELIARGAFVVRTDMPEDLRLAIQEALLSAPPEVVEQCNLDSSRFGAAPPDVYDPIREIQEYIGLTD